MLRRSLVGAVTAISGLLCLAPIAVTAHRDSARYVDKTDHYSLRPPPGWTRNMEAPRPYVAFMGPTEQGFQPNFSIFSETAANRSLASYVKVSSETIKKNKQMRLLSNRVAHVDGVPAALIETIVDAPGHPQSIARQVITVRNARGYMLTFVAAPATMKRLTPAFDKVVSSFRWER